MLLKLSKESAEPWFFVLILYKGFSPVTAGILERFAVSPRDFKNLVFRRLDPLGSQNSPKTLQKKAFGPKDLK